MEVTVQTTNGPKVWNVVPNLTDRWGDLNYHDKEAKGEPLFALEKDEELLDRLRGQMSDEVTFIAFKDGGYGILFEAEYCSVESEEQSGNDQGFKDGELKPQSEVEKYLLSKISELEKKYPEIEFCVPPKEEVIWDRPAVWAFAKDKQLTSERASGIASAILSL